MYQRQEFILKKNKNVMEKYDEAMEKAAEIAETDNYDNDEDRRAALINGIYIEGSKAYNYMKSTVTSEEKKIYEETAEVWDFYYNHIMYYIDMVKIISNFNHTAMPWCNSNEKPIVNIDITENDNENELQIIIEEFWNNDFETECLNPLFEDGFRPGVGYDEVPRAARELLKLIDFHTYLQKRFAEEHEKFGKQLCYDCISRYYDEITNGEGAIGVFDHSENKYTMYGYGTATNGWSGDLLKETVVDRSVFSNEPERIWYPTNPKNFWYPLGPLDDDFYDDWESDNDKMWDAFPKKYEDCIQEYNDEGIMTYDDNTDAYTVLEMFSFWDKNSEYEKKEDMEGMTGAEVLELIDALEALNKNFIQMQKNSCARNGRDYSKYANDGFGVNLLFFNNNMDIVYINTEKEDETGIKSGKLTIHHKNFRQE